MEFIIMFIIILINATLFTIKLKNRIETNIPLAVVSLILVVYVFGLIDKLLYGIIAIIMITFLELIYEVIFFKKNKSKLKEILLVPGIFVYFALGLFFINFNTGILFREYDEFSHWGLIVKNMFEFGDFGISSVVKYVEYPPYISIFQYMFLVFKNCYSEDVVIIGLNLLYLSFMIPLLRNIKWDKSLFKLIVLIPVIVLIPIIFYGDFYITLFVDGFLGCIFAYTICSWYIYKGKARYISVIFGCIALVLTKSIGIFLAIASIIIFLIDTKIFKNKELNIRKKDFKVLLILILLIISIYGTWQLKINKESKKWYIENITIENIVQIVKGEGKYYQKITIKNFLEEAFFSRGSLTSRDMNLINLFGFLIIFDLIVVRKRDNRYVVMSVELILFWFVYIIIQLLMYLFIFTQQEAMILACFQRYILLIPFAIVIIDIFLLEEKYQNEKINIKYTLIILAIILMFLPIDIIKDLYIENDKDKMDREEYRKQFEVSSDYKNIIDKDDKIYYINNFTDDREIIIVKYNFLPYQIVNDSSKLKMTVDEFVEILKGENYTHVYIRLVDRILENKFKELFDDGVIENNTMYEIIKENDNIIFSKVE